MLLCCRSTSVAATAPYDLGPREESLIVTPIAIGVIVFACILGGALIGMLLSAALPEHHRSPESKDVVRLGMA